MAPSKQIQEYDNKENKENKSTNTSSSHNDDKDDDFLISADPSKYVTLPVHHEKIWRMYQTTLDWFWTVYDVYLTNDRDNMTAILPEDQTRYVLEILTFMFTSHHAAINKDLFMQFMSQVDIKEASYYLGSQADSKKTHSMMYSMLLDELVGLDKPEDKERLIRDVVQIPEVREFLHWVILGTTSATESFAKRLLTFACLQGIIFTGPFLLLKWLGKQHPSKMLGMNQSNELIWRDEKLNLNFSCMLFEYIDDELTEKEAYKIVGEAVAHAKCLFTKVFPSSTLGLDCQLVEQYLEYSADIILSDLQFSKLYNKEKPFDWADGPKTGASQTKTPINNVIDMSASFGEAKFSTELDF